MSESLEGQPPAGAAPATPDPAGQQDWRTGLPEDIRDNPNFKKYSSLESFAKGHLNAVSMLGKPVDLKIPENPDDRSEFFNKLGRPESPDKYTLKEYEYPEDVKPVVQARVKEYKDVAHNLGLTAEQAENLYDWYASSDLADSKNISETRTKQEAESTQALRKEWGEKYDHNVKVAQHALTQFGGEELWEYLDKTGLGNNPHLVKAFQNIGESILGDDTLVTGEARAPAEIQGQVNEIMSKKEYWDPNSIERPALVRKVSELMQRLHPEG